MGDIQITPVQDVYKDKPATPAESVTPIADAYVNKPEVQTDIKNKSGISAYLSGMENDRLAALQHTQPHLDIHSKNFLGDALHEWDDGTVTYKDAEGKEQPTNAREHVVLKDPETGGYKIYKRSEETDVGPIKSGILAVGRMLGEGMGGSVMPVKTPITATQKAMQAAARVKATTGVEVPLSKAGISENLITRTAARVVSNLPGGSGPLEHAAEATRANLGAAAQRAAEIPTGVAATAEEAGQAAKFGINERIKPKEGLFDQGTRQAYDKVDSFVQPEAKHTLENTLAVAGRIQKEYSAAEHEGIAPAVKEVLGAVTHPEGITYQGLKRLRTDIGEAINSGVNAGVSNGDLKSLYAGLSSDMEGLITSQGGKRGLAAWKKAGDLAKVNAAKKEKLATILGSETKSDEGIFAALLRKASGTSTADAKGLALARRSMSPSEWKEVQSAVTRRLGWKELGNERHFDPNTFLHDYGKLSDAGKNLLFDKRLRTALDGISELSTRWDKIKEIGHAPGPLQHLVGTFGAFHGLQQGVGEFLKVLSGIVGVTYISKLLSKPATAESVKNWLTNYRTLALKPTQGNLQVFNNSSRILSKDAAEQSRDEIGHGVDKAGEMYSKLRDLVKGKQ